MMPGDVILLPVPGVGGGPAKIRPAALLALLPGGPYQNVFVCGISTRLNQLQPDWDELIRSTDAEFRLTGLHQTSAIRPSFLYAADMSQVMGVIGRIDDARLSRIRRRICKLLEP